MYGKSTTSKPVYTRESDSVAVPLMNVNTPIRAVQEEYHDEYEMEKSNTTDELINNRDHQFPNLMSRAGAEDDADAMKQNDDLDGRVTRPLPERPQYPQPSFLNEMEFGGIPDYESIPDVNVYQHKKTLAQGMMDLALFSANANQLRYVLESYERHPYYWPSLLLISLSLMLQVLIGVGLIMNSRYNVKDEKEICIANKISNYTIVGIFIVTSVNVFISAFGVATPAPSITPPTTP